MKKIKDSRAASFLIIAIVYVIAAAAGIAVYLALPLDWWIRLLIADVVATVVTFAFSCIFGNSSVYDPYWSVQPIVIIVAYAVGCGQLNAMRILLLISICFWGIRLTANWAYTFKNRMPYAQYIRTVSPEGWLQPNTVLKNGAED